jgi:hypothetical protein
MPRTMEEIVLAILRPVETIKLAAVGIFHVILLRARNKNRKKEDLIL